VTVKHDELYKQALSVMTQRQLFAHYDELDRQPLSENLERMSLTLAELERRGVRGLRIDGKWLLS
jgi:hypothetical protein